MEYVEIIINDDGTKTTYGRKYPAPYGWKNTEKHKIIEMPDKPEDIKDHRPQKMYDLVDDTRTKTGYKWVLNNEKWLNRKIRPERNKLLKETDWTQVADNGMSEKKKLAYKEYRQKLRDLTDVIEYGSEQWPEEPRR